MFYLALSALAIAAADGADVVTAAAVGILLSNCSVLYIYQHVIYICIYIYTQTHTCVCVYMNIYIYIKISI